MVKKPPLRPSIEWHVELGDLVKITRYDFNGAPHHLCGVIISRQQECQVEMFPYVNVYVFTSNEVSKCYLNNIEIISHRRE
jgi:hypothetical protein